MDGAASNAVLPCSIPVESNEAAGNIGLVYVSDGNPGIRRRRSGKGFSYRDPDGARVNDRETLARIRKLGIPPAYTDVWICPDPGGHIQATGRDAKGRKQYRYHERFRAIRDGAKYERMLSFAEALPDMRRIIDAHISLPGLPRDKVMATIVRLLETTMIRIGNADYAKANKSYGLTTLRSRHVSVNGTELKFRFRGKSGKEWRLSIRDRRVARTVKACQELPGQHLFRYLDDNGVARDVTSGDVNTYLRQISGQNITAKDFRTWAGTVLAAMALAGFDKADTAAAAKRNIRAAIESVAARLGNTPTICRKCYIHPEILECYLAQTLLIEAANNIAEDSSVELTPEEHVVLKFLRARLSCASRRLDAA